MTIHTTYTLSATATHPWTEVDITGANTVMMQNQGTTTVLWLITASAPADGVAAGAWLTAGQDRAISVGSSDRLFVRAALSAPADASLNVHTTTQKIAVDGGVNLSAGDIQIGAVELKNDIDDTRAKVGPGAKANALRVTLADDGVGAQSLGAPSDAYVTDPAASGSMIALLKGSVSWLANMAGRWDSTGKLQVAVHGNNTVTITDRSGTITAGGTAQTIAAANASRRGFEIQNQSTTDLYMSTLATAVLTQPSLRIPPGALYEMPSTSIRTGAVSVIGATTGQAFYAREIT